MIFRCSECKREYEKRSSMQYHQTTRCKTTQRFYCFVCDFTAPSKKLIDHHLNSVHPNIDLKNYSTCSKCGKDLQNLDLLRKHFQLCGKYFVCEFCPYKSIYVSNLTRHSQNNHPRSQIAGKKLNAVKSIGMNCNRAFYLLRNWR